MCGIFGSVGHVLSDEAARNVLRMLHHRGPDGDGLFADESARISLVHTRLAVIDLQTGGQPLHSRDGNLTLICNGELYDFERIRAELEAKGYSFKSKSDSEVILYLYEEYGLGCFEHLRGEFAFLLYDRSNRLFLAARDRFGIKPLYFSTASGGFVFASEMKAIFASGLVEPKLNVAALDPVLNQDPAQMRFPFEGIEHVPPASFMAVDLDTWESTTTRYWSPEIPSETAQPVKGPVDDAAERCARTVLEELDEAVRLRLRADVPVGLYLSGGLDSVFVGALMKRNLNARFHSFSISFVGSEKNEADFARAASDFMASKHHELPVTKGMLWDNLEDCLWATELPFVSLAPVGKFLLSKAAREHVTVVLNGQGADEVFLGYRAFFQKAIDDTRKGARRDSALVRRLDLGGSKGAVLKGLSLLLVDKRQRAQLRSARAVPTKRQASAKPLINEVQESRIAEMPVDILGFLGDRVEMAHSLEVRVPFLDHHLYDKAKTIPIDFKMRDGIEKAVLRDAGKGILPEVLRLRRKRGFMFTSDPIDFDGTDRPLTGRLRRHLSRDAFERSGIFSYPAYRAVKLLARLPARRLRRTANSVMMYMMQVHMLHDMYIANPRWAEPKLPGRSAA
ncbi:MAG: asparagine synthase (glutamine-hydrolyzing) [Sphingomicrobium sp.]